MRIILFGQNGQVAREVQRCAAAHRVSLTVLGREAADLADEVAVANALGGLLSDADAIINAAAYTAVDRAEDEPDLAMAVNGTAPAVMARAAAAAGVPLLHVSTDYVFDGSGTRPWAENAPTGPISVYGRTKLAGEDGVRAAGGAHAILRTSWVFSSTGNNFVRTMLRLGSERDRLTVVADQIGGPTPAAAIADALLRTAAGLAAGGPSGTYHFAGAPDVSWADFARAIMAQAGLSTEVADIPTSAYPTPARRPANSRLDCARLRDEYGIDRPDWRQGLATVLAELGQERAH